MDGMNAATCTFTVPVTWHPTPRYLDTLHGGVPVWEARDKDGHLVKTEASFNRPTDATCQVRAMPGSFTFERLKRLTKADFRRTR